MPEWPRRRRISALFIRKSHFLIVSLLAVSFSDITNGRGPYRVPCINDIDDAPPPAYKHIERVQVSTQAADWKQRQLDNASENCQRLLERVVGCVSLRNDYQ